MTDTTQAMAVKTEIKNLFNKLSTIETNNLESITTPSTNFAFFKDTFSDFDMKSSKGEAKRVLTNSPSLAEAYLIDSIYKLMAIQRDVIIRSKTRLDFFLESTNESGEERSRLARNQANTILYSFGDSNTQNQNAT